MAFTRMLSYALILSWKTSDTSGFESLVTQRPSTEDGVFDYAVAIHPIPALYNFTLCYSLKPYRIHRVMVAVSYATDENDNEIRIEHTPESWRILVYEKLVSLLHELVPHRWFTFCFSIWMWDDQNYFNLSMQVDNDSSLHQVITLDTKCSGLKGGGSLILGQDQDVKGNDFQSQQAFTGEISRVSIWTHATPSYFLVNLARQENPHFGNFLLWPEGWQKKGKSRWRTLVREELSGGTRNILQFIGVSHSLEQHDRLCSSLQGEVGYPVNADETKLLMDTASPWMSRCAGGSFVLFMWLGVSDRYHEGSWKSLKGKPLNYTNWIHPEPNGGKNENCVGVKGTGHGAGKWYDIMCDGSPLCAPCRFLSRPRLRLRGSCINSEAIDEYYVLHPESHDGLYFVGFSKSSIKQNVGHHYSLAFYNDATTIAVLDDSDSAVSPVGRYWWDVKQDKVCPGATANSSVMLLFSSCNEDQFTCNSGACIPLTGRCDHNENCIDGSDELNCSVVIFPSSYRREHPPPSIPLSYDEKYYLNNFDVSQTTPNQVLREDGPLFVYLYVDITAITSLDALDMKLNLEFTLDLIWRDSRLSFNNLASDQNLNRIRSTTARNQWIPEVSFDNAHGNSHTLIDDETRLVVLRQGLPTISPSTHPFEDLEYRGLDNPLRMSRKYNVTFSCALELNMYPFDKQTCNAMFKMTSGTSEYIILRSDGDGVKYSGGQHLVEYEVMGVNMKSLSATEDTLSSSGSFEAETFPSSPSAVTTVPSSTSSSSTSIPFVGSSVASNSDQEYEEYFSGILEKNYIDVSTKSRYSRLQVELHFRRRYGFYLINTFLPTSLMIVIAYLTFYFEIEDFNDRIMVSLTSLLVLSSLFNQSSSSMPKTSYFKLVDVWFFTCIVIIFIIIVIQTVLEYLRESEEGRRQHPRRFTNLVKPFLKLSFRKRVSFEKHNKENMTPSKAWNAADSYEDEVTASHRRNLHSGLIRWRSSHDMSAHDGVTKYFKNANDLKITELDNPTHDQSMTRVDQEYSTEAQDGRHRLSWKICSRLGKVALLLIFAVFLIIYWSLALSSYQM